MSCLNSFDFITGFSVEYMHSALLGVSRGLFNLWLDPTHCRDTLHDLRGSIPQLNKLISLIQVPSLIGRKPRALTDLKHWKGNEN